MRIAVLGTGQLARMLALDGIAMGVEFSFIKTPGEDSRCVDHLGVVVESVSGLSIGELYKCLASPDVVTTEKESVNVDFYEQFSTHCRVSPPSKAVWISQNRLREKTFLNDFGVPTAAYAPAATLDQTLNAADKIGYPVIVKTQENGYDGKGQWWLDGPADIAKMQGAEDSAPWLIEKVVPFEREISVVAARSATGEITVYPLAENVHRNGILLTSRVPVEGLSAVQEQEVQAHISRLMTELDYVGVLSMECFVTVDGILANELAPRVHNSGHWTQNSVESGQFAQHVRALLGWPLGGVSLEGCAGMVNLLGVEADPQRVLKPGQHLHWYGKTVLPGRKVGHINVIAATPMQLKQKLSVLVDELYPD